ncbi:MAG: hypothetical protein O7I93_07085 [Gemmatimonadetes bacterium]|nr:hypothetical protein [Gemmatimonadota bacterium]
MHSAEVPGWLAEADHALSLVSVKATVTRSLAVKSNSCNDAA